MTENEIDKLVNELQNDSVELWAYIANVLDDKEGEEIDAMAEELKNSPLDLREFILNNL